MLAWTQWLFAIIPGWQLIWVFCYGSSPRRNKAGRFQKLWETAFYCGKRKAQSVCRYSVPFHNPLHLSKPQEVISILPTVCEQGEKTIQQELIFNWRQGLRKAWKCKMTVGLSLGCRAALFLWIFSGISSRAWAALLTSRKYCVSVLFTGIPSGAGW